MSQESTTPKYTFRCDTTAEPYHDMYGYGIYFGATDTEGPFHAGNDFYGQTGIETVNEMAETILAASLSGGNFYDASPINFSDYTVTFHADHMFFEDKYRDENKTYVHPMTARDYASLFIDLLDARESLYRKSR